MRDAVTAEESAPIAGRPLIFPAEIGIEGLADAFVLAGNLVEERQALIEKPFLLRAKPGAIMDNARVKKKTAARAQLALLMPEVKPFGGPLQRSIGLHGPLDMTADVLK